MFQNFTIHYVIRYMLYVIRLGRCRVRIDGVYSCKTSCPSRRVAHSRPPAFRRVLLNSWVEAFHRSRIWRQGMEHRAVDA